MTNSDTAFYSQKNILKIAAVTGLYLIVSVLLLGFKTDQLVLAGIFNSFYFFSPASRKFILAFAIFIVYWVIYDYMKAFPNYKFNSVHIEDLYGAEKSLFGINATGKIITPNEYWIANQNSFLDVMTGVFYLCWIPVPLAFAAWLFFKDKDKDINIMGAYLHLLSDAMVAFGVVLSGIAIYYTHWYWIDTAISFMIAIMILVSTWRLLSDSIRLALDGVPRNVNMKKVEEAILKFKEVKQVYHIHVWALSSNENALTAHVVVCDNDIALFEKAKQEIKHTLQHLNIHHSTLEVETASFSGKGICAEEVES